MTSYDEGSRRSGLDGVSVAMMTMGCAKNEVDSKGMSALLEDAGARIVDDVRQSDIIIVNTCSFIQSAAEESIDAVFDSLGICDSLGSIPVVVTGCMPSRYGHELEEEFGEVAAFVPCCDEGDIVSVVSSCLQDRSREDADALDDISSASLDGFNEELDPVHDGRYFAYVKISDGCDRWCSYCTIPMIRGRYHSFEFEDIDRQVTKLVAEGKKEIVLIAQDTGRWGEDLDGGRSLAWLLRKLAEKHADTWFRVMYVQPEGITDDLLDVIAGMPNVCSYLDIPFQHIDAGILRAMNRSGNRSDLVELIEHAREVVSDIALRTTLITGFPGEGEEEFEALKDFVEEGYFDYVGIFPYSCEEGTRAAKLPDQVDEEEKHYRAQVLRDVADAVSAVNISNRIGKTTAFMVEGRESDGQLVGRCQWQAPEVDGITFLDGGDVGCIVDATISDTLFFDMEAEMKTGDH